MPLSESKTVHVVGVPLDHGAGRRGVGMGPAAMRIAGLHGAIERIGHRVLDRGDISIPAPETQPEGESRAKFLPLITDACAQVAREVEAALAAGGLPLVLGGDHSIAIGTISGIAGYLYKKSGQKPPRLGVVWFDAHGDINTPETTPSGNIHGMPVSCLLANGPAPLASIGFQGPKFSPSMFAQVGLRDIDDTEKRLLRESGIRCFTMEDIDKRGMAAVMDEAIAVASRDSDMLHVSFDIDAIDPRVAPGTGTPKLGGLTYREAHLAMEMLADSRRVTSIEMVEVNPVLDERNSTAELAVGLVASALGKRIL